MDWLNEVMEIPRWCGLLQFVCLLGLFGIFGTVAVAKKREIEKLKLMIKPDAETGQTQNINDHEPIQ